MTAVPLLERERELRAADALLADAAHDRGRLLCIEAPPGMGKSTLIEHIVRARTRGGMRGAERRGPRARARTRLGRRAVAVRVGCRALHRAGARRAAQRLRGGRRGAVRRRIDTEGRSPDDLRFAILHGLYWLAVRLAEGAPLVLIVDDAHWADEPSLRLLSYLQSRIREQPVAVLVAARVDEPGEGGLLAQLLADPATTVCELTPLSPAAVADLIRGRVPDADDALCRRCAELTAGNPLGVRELGWALADGDATDLDASAEQAARSLSRSTRQRLRALPPHAGASRRRSRCSRAASRSTGRRRSRTSPATRRWAPPTTCRARTSSRPATRSSSPTRCCAPRSTARSRGRARRRCTAARPRCCSPRGRRASRWRRICS